MWTGIPSFCLLSGAKHPAATCALASLNGTECVGNAHGLCVFWVYLYDLPSCGIRCLRFSLFGVRKRERRHIISGKNFGRLPLCSFTPMTPVIFTLVELMSLSGDFASSVIVQKGCCFMARALICLLDWFTSNECPTGLFVWPGGRNAGFPEPHSFQSLSSP